MQGAGLPGRGRAAGFTHLQVEALANGEDQGLVVIADQVFGGAAHSNIAIEYGLQGPGTTNSNSCASANVALGDALTWIRNGKADVVVAGAADSPLAPLTYCAFDNINTRWARDRRRALGME